MPDIPIEKPIPIPSPRDGYDRVMVWLAVSPRHVGGGVDYTVAIRARPYRVLEDGTIDEAPERMDRSVAIGSVDEEIATSGKYAEACLGILTILRRGLAGIGG